MRRKLYGNNIQPSCELCENGRPSSDGTAILCLRKGVVPLYYRCRRFRYTPLRRSPNRIPTVQSFSPDAFTLEAFLENTNETD